MALRFQVYTGFLSEHLRQEKLLDNGHLPPIFQSLDGDLGSYINPENTMLLEKRVRQWEAQLVRKGKSEGREEGIQRGRRDGLKRGKVQSICRFLEARFGVLPADIELKLKDIEDLAELDSLAVAAATVADLGEFLKALP